MKPTLFCHVRKTGGTTLHRVFQIAVGADRVSPGHGSEAYSNALRRWEKLKVISQHIWFAPGELLSRDRINLTVLREPIARCLSNYYYVRSQDPVFNPDALERRLSLFDFAFQETGYVKAEMENHQTKLFAPLALSSQDSSPSEERLLQAAKAALDSFELVGLTEHLAETVDLISWFTGMKTVAVLPRERATDSRPSLEDVPPDIRRKLKAQNRLDEELYAYARTKFRSLTRRCFASLLELKALAEDQTGRAAAPSTRLGTPETTEPQVAGVQSHPARISGRFGTHEISILEVTLSGSVSLSAPEFISGEYLSIKIHCHSSVDVEDVTAGIHIHDHEGRLVYGTNTWQLRRRIRTSRDSNFDVVFCFQVTMGTGRYRVGATLHTGNSHLDRCFDWYDDCATFGVVGVVGFHFEGLMNLQSSLVFKCETDNAQLLEVEHSRRGFVALGRHNRPIEKPEGRVSCVVDELNIHAGDVFSVELEITNAGDVPWEEDGRRCTKLCYRWIGIDGTALVHEGERNNIGGDLLPGDSRRVWMTVKTPLDHAGSATLRITLLQEHVAWFDQLGKLYCDVPATIQQ